MSAFAVRLLLADCREDVARYVGLLESRRLNGVEILATQVRLRAARARMIELMSL